MKARFLEHTRMSKFAFGSICMELDIKVILDGDNVKFNNSCVSKSNYIYVVV